MSYCHEIRFAGLFLLSVAPLISELYRFCESGMLNWASDQVVDALSPLAPSNLQKGAGQGKHQKKIIFG